MSKINRSDLELLQKIFKYLVVELKADKASRKEVLAAIKASGIKVLPAGALKFLIKEGFVVEDGDDIIIIKNKGGEKITHKAPSKRRKLTKEEKTLCRNLIKNKRAYKGLEIDGKYIWGIGKYAITLVDEIHTPEGHHSNSWTFSGKKEFHNYFKKINKPSNYDDGVEIAKKIMKKHGKRGEKWE